MFFLNLAYLENTQFFAKYLYLILGNSIQEKKIQIKIGHSLLLSFSFSYPFSPPVRPYITILIMNVPKYLQNTYSDIFDAQNRVSNAPF